MKTHFDTAVATEMFRNALAFFLISAFVGVLPLLVFKTIPIENKEIIVYMIGQLSGMATTALGLYFTNKAGDAALDAKRTENTGKALDLSAAAVASSGSGDAVGLAADEVAGAATNKAAEIKGDAT